MLTGDGGLGLVQRGELAGTQAALGL